MIPNRSLFSSPAKSIIFSTFCRKDKKGVHVSVCRHDKMLYVITEPARTLGNPAANAWLVPFWAARHERACKDDCGGVGCVPFLAGGLIYAVGPGAADLSERNKSMRVGVCRWLGRPAIANWAGAVGNARQPGVRVDESILRHWGVREKKRVPSERLRTWLLESEGLQPDAEMQAGM